MVFLPDKNELATDFKVRITVADTADLIAVLPWMRRKIYFSAQLPFLLEELERRGHNLREGEKPSFPRSAKSFVVLLAGLALVVLFFDLHATLSDMIYEDLVRWHLVR